MDFLFDIISRLLFTCSISYLPYRQLRRCYFTAARSVVMNCNNCDNYQHMRWESKEINWANYFHLLPTSCNIQSDTKCRVPYEILIYVR